MKQLLLVILCLGFLTVGSAQITSNVSISKDTLAIGEEAVLNFSISLPIGAKIKEVSIINFDSIQTLAKTSDIPDSLLRETYAEIEWPQEMNFDSRAIPINQFVKNSSLLEKDIAIRFWDIGAFKLPQLIVTLDSTSRNYSVNHLESPIVFVLPPEGVQPIDTTQMLLPISNIIKEGRTWEDFIWLAYLWLFLITLALVLYMIKKSRKKTELVQEEEVIIVRPAHELSLEKLTSLRDKQLWQQGKIKDYQSELTYIIREYLENRFGIQALESTTEEIARDLKKQDFDPSQEQNLKEILQIADLVKFAKANPETSVHDKFMDQAKDFVEQTKKLIEELENNDELAE